MLTWTGADNARTHKPKQIENAKMRGRERCKKARERDRVERVECAVALSAFKVGCGAYWIGSE